MKVPKRVPGGGQAVPRVVETNAPLGVREVPLGTCVAGTGMLSFCS